MIKRLSNNYTIKQLRDELNSILKNNPNNENTPIFCFYTNDKGLPQAIDILQLKQVFYKDGDSVCGIILPNDEDYKHIVKSE